MHLQQMAKVSGEKQEDENYGAGEDDADESLGENVESDYRGDAPAGKQRWFFVLPAVEEEVKGDADPESDSAVRNKDAREEIRSARGQDNHGGPEAGLRRQEAAAEEVQEEGERENAQVKREAGAPRVNAEKFDGDGGAPVGKRGFFKVADVVFVEGDPVVADENFAAGVGVGGVDVVLERRGE